MTGSPGSPAGPDRAQASHAASEHARQIERERGGVQEVVAHLRAEERRWLSDAEALRAERKAINAELAEARDRLAGLDASLKLRQLGVVAKEREIAEARAQLETQRALADRVERELEEHRAQIATARRKLGGLVEDVLRIQHKLWRAASGE
jgi:chromosome segregation ATPase